MSAEKKSRHSLFLFSKSIIIKGAYYYENHSKCNQNFEKEVLP